MLQLMFEYKTIRHFKRSKILQHRVYIQILSTDYGRGIALKMSINLSTLFELLNFSQLFDILRQVMLDEIKNRWKGIGLGVHMNLRTIYINIEKSFEKKSENSEIYFYKSCMHLKNLSYKNWKYLRFKWHLKNWRNWNIKKNWYNINYKIFE